MLNLYQPVKPCLQQEGHEENSKPKHHTQFSEVNLGLNCEDERWISGSVFLLHHYRCISMAKLLKMHFGPWKYCKVFDDGFGTSMDFFVFLETPLRSKFSPSLQKAESVLAYLYWGRIIKVVLMVRWGVRLM